MKHPKKYVWDDEAYTRSYDIGSFYTEDVSHFIARMEGDDLETVKAFVSKETAPGGDGKLAMKDPRMAILYRQPNEDRVREIITFQKYLNTVERNKLLMSPSGTVYENPERHESILGGYTQGRLDERKIIKGEMKIHQLKEEKVLYDIKDAQQNSCKIDANSLSGAFNSVYTMLFLKTAHSTLTSTCRTTTAYANANNEKFITGNRHFWKPELVISQIASTVCQINKGRFESVCKRFNIRYPTVEETMECILYSTKLYWTSEYWEALIFEYVSKLEPIERAIFVYIGDLYHLAKYNDQFVRQLFTDLLEVNINAEDVDVEAAIKSVDDEVAGYVSMAESRMLKGKTVKDLDPIERLKYAVQVVRLYKNLEDYGDFIETFWASPVVPASVASFPTSIRRSVIAGDTDSTIFTVQFWVPWFCGKMEFSKRAYTVAGFVIYSTVNMIEHQLAMMSINMGLLLKDIRQITMKNEFFFPVFVPTQRSKHYFAFQEIREGNVFNDFHLELKGAELRNANTPKLIKDAEMVMIKDIMNQVIQTGEVDIDSVLQQVAVLEHKIRDDISKGGFKYFRLSQIKNKDAYSVPNPPAYQHYEMWQEVFAVKYGQADPPPIQTVSFKIAAKNKTQIAEWLECIEDRQVAARMERWLSSNNKKSLTELKLPLAILQSTGVPIELIGGAAMSKVISVIMSPFYVILEALGFFYITKPVIRLVSDIITRDQVAHLIVEDEYDPSQEIVLDDDGDDEYFETEDEEGEVFID